MAYGLTTLPEFIYPEITQEQFLGKLGNRHLIVGAWGLQSGVGPKEIAPHHTPHPHYIPKTECWLCQLLQEIMPSAVTKPIKISNIGCFNRCK